MLHNFCVFNEPLRIEFLPGCQNQWPAEFKSFKMSSYSKVHFSILYTGMEW